MWFKNFKYLLPYILSAFILIFSITPNIYVYANGGAESVVFNSETFVDDVSEKEFLNGIKKRQEYIYISNMNEGNRWLLLRSLFFKYFKNEFMQGYYTEVINSSRLIKVAYETNLRTNFTKYYIKVSDEFYIRLDNPDYSEEFNKHIDQLIINAGIIDNMTNMEKIDRMVIYLCDTYRYDSDKYYDYIYTSNKPYWKIVSDYGVTLCLSDSMLLKACLKRLGIECRLIFNSNHAWNQVYIDDKWMAIDITWYREYRRYYKYFDDSNREINYIIN